MAGYTGFESSTNAELVQRVSMNVDHYPPEVQEMASRLETLIQQDRQTPTSDFLPLN